MLVARVLFPIDPLELVRDESAQLRRRLAQALEDVATALELGDRDRAAAALDALEELDDRRLEDAVVLAREVARQAPRRRPLRKRIDALSVAWHELEASASDARAIATGALRMLDEKHAPAPSAAAVIRAAADAVRTIDQQGAEQAADRARAAAERLRAEDASLGASVLGHGVDSIADHAVRRAAARAEDSRLAEESRTGINRLRVRKTRDDEHGR